MKFIHFTVFKNVADAMTNTPYIGTFPFPSMYRDKIIVAECDMNGMHIIRSWKNKNYLSIDDDMPSSSNEMVGALDYTFTKNQFKIEYIWVKDHDDMGGLEFDPKYVHAKPYNALMIAIAERKASVLDMNIMTMDTHKSLRLYNQYYKDEKFVLTGKKASDHDSWVETERTINK